MSKPSDPSVTPTPTTAAPAAPVDSLIEPHDELLRLAVSADELAEKIWSGQGTDLNHLIGDAIQSRAAPRAA